MAEKALGSIDETLSLSDITDLLVGVAHQWHTLGVQLRIPIHDLEQLRNNSPQQALQEVISKWLESTDHPTWRVLIDALQLNTIGRRLAKKITDEYGAGPLRVHPSKTTAMMTSMQSNNQSPAAFKPVSPQPRSSSSPSSPSSTSTHPPPLPASYTSSTRRQPHPLAASVVADGSEAITDKKQQHTSRTAYKQQPKAKEPLWPSGSSELPASPPHTHTHHHYTHHHSLSSLHHSPGPISSPSPSLSPKPHAHTSIKYQESSVSSQLVRGKIQPATQQVDIGSTSSLSRNSSSANSNSYHSAEEEPILIASMRPFTQPHSFTSATERQSVQTQTPQDQLYSALITKNADRVEVLLKQMQQVDGLLKDGRTALMLASAEGETKIMTILLAHGASVDATDPEGWTPLHFASSYGNYDATKVLIKHFADVNRFTKDGTPMLLRPASKGFSIVTEYLLQKKSRPNDSDKDGVTPLIAASKNGHKDVVRVLLENGADPRIMTKLDARTAMMEAVQGEHTEIVAMLTRAISQAMEKSHQLFKVRTAEEVRRLLKEGVRRVDERRGDGVTPLMAASEQGNLEVVQELVDQHANLDLQDQDGLSALMVASRNGHDPVVQLLIANKAIIDLKSKKKWTALMYAVHHGHVKVVHALLAARADPTVRDASGKTAHDLAKEGKQNEILEHLSRQSTAVTGVADPFLRQLSAHLLEKEKSSKKSVMTEKKKQTTARREEGFSKALMRRPPEAHGGTVKDELSQAWQRIAELETQNHGLTIQTTMGPLDSSDLSYLERNRLEEEYRKTKELKRKAEQYAIEAKQTSQRLSAENFKLKEDLSREQHFNELTRKSMMTGIEEKVKQARTSGELAEVKREEFMEASKQHAMEIVSRMGHRAGFSVQPQKVDLDPTILKQTILSETITMDVLQICVGGLPGSGRSTLLDRIIGIKSSEDRLKHCQIVISNTMLSFETVALQESHQKVSWITSTTARPEVVAIAAALAKVYSSKGQIPNLVNITSACWGEEDPVLDSLFRDTLQQVSALLERTEKEGMLDQLANSPLSLINWWDVNRNKVSYEAASILAGHCHNLLLLNVLSLPKHGLCLNLPLSNETQAMEQLPADDIQILLRILPAFHYYFRTIAICCQIPKHPHSALLVGTFADKLRQDASSLQRAKKEVFHSVKARAQEIGISEVVSPALIAVDATKEEDSKKVWEALKEMIAKDQRFKYEVHLKWIFLRCALFSTQSTFILRTKVFQLAKKCGILDNSELEECLSLFQSYGSIICSNSGDSPIPALNEYIIINPLKFLKGLGKLYYYEHNTLEESRKYMKNGFVTSALAKQLWGDEHRIYLQILQDMGVLVRVDEILQEDPDYGWKERISCYFMPSLRSGRYETPLTSQSTSLVIAVPSELPFQSQADFVLYFKTHYRNEIKVVPNDVFNVTHFKWCDPNHPKETADIHMRFLSGCAEIAIVPSTNITPAQSKLIHRSLCSIFKTAAVEVCYKLAQVLPNLRYKLSVVCPNSSVNLPHYIHFHALENFSGQKMTCHSCNEFIKLTDERVWWIEAAYQGPTYHALHPDDILSQSLLRELVHSLSTLTHPQLLSLSSALGFSESEVSSRQFTSHGDLVQQLLMEWQRRVPVCTKQNLASALLKCGHYQLAIKLDPALYATALPLPPSPLTMKTLTTLSHCVSDWYALGLQLGLETQHLDVIDSNREQQSTREKALQVLLVWRELNNSEPDSRKLLVSIFKNMGLRKLAEYLLLEFSELGIN